MGGVVEGGTAVVDAERDEVEEDAGGGEEIGGFREAFVFGFCRVSFSRSFFTCNNPAVLVSA